eukprot:5682655-Pleurochrysis_carterae.AAC.2
MRFTDIGTGFRVYLEQPPCAPRRSCLFVTFSVEIDTCAPCATSISQQSRCTLSPPGRVARRGGRQLCRLSS